MKNYKELLNELPSKTVVFTCGRFNPPNVGHELTIKVVRKLARQRKADHFIFVSSIQDAKKNPLEIGKKLQYLGSLFPNTRFIQKELEQLGSVLKKYKHVTMVVAADSMDYYKKLLKKIGITDVEFVKAGSNCPDEDDKLIKLASKGEYLQFKSSLPTTVRDLDGKRLMNDIRIGLELEPIKEQINLVKDDLREKYFRGEIFNEGDIVECNDTAYKIIKRGSNHLLLQSEQGLKVSKWIQDVQLTERQFMLNEKLLKEDDQTAAGTKGLANANTRTAERQTKMAELKAKQARDMENMKEKQAQELATVKSNMAEAKDSPVVDKGSKYNIAKSIMSLHDFRKTMGMGVKGVDQEAMDDKQTESDLDASTHATKSPQHTVTGGHHMDAGKDESLRRMRARYHLGEEQIDELSKTTLGNYIKANKADTVDRASSDSFKSGKAGDKYNKADETHKDKMRDQGLGRAVSKLTKEETEEQQKARKEQLKRFSDQTKSVNVDKVHTAGQEPHEEKFENFKEEFGYEEEELIALVEADLEALTEEDFYEAYDEEELAIIDEETGEEIEAVAEEAELDAPALMEVLSRVERIRAKARMRRSQTKRERRQKVAVRQLSTPQVANRRARRMAVSALKKRLLRGQNPNKVSVGQKERIERFIQQRRKIVDRLATRMVSRVKQVERARMSHKKFTKPNNGVSF
jgi:uncharacterized protein YnzC (UPF0291/DUF896 family)